MLAACLVIGAALAIFGSDDVGRRLETLTHGISEENEWSGGRITLWTRVARGNPRLFSVRGRRGKFQSSLSDIFRRRPERVLEFAHAESSYLQDLLESGCVGLGLTLACIVSWGSWCGLDGKVPSE